MIMGWLCFLMYIDGAPPKTAAIMSYDILYYLAISLDIPISVDPGKLPSRNWSGRPES